MIRNTLARAGVALLSGIAQALLLIFALWCVGALLGVVAVGFRMVAGS